MGGPRRRTGGRAAMGSPRTPPGDPEGSPEADRPSSSNLFDYPFLSKRSNAPRSVIKKGAAGHVQKAASEVPSPRLLSQAVQYKQEEFNVPTVCSGPAPSIRREEREAMINLRKRVAPHQLVKGNRSDRESSGASKPPNANLSETASKFLQRIFWSRPLSIVVELSEIRTAWQDSDFITECICWHNVYRQRHGSPPLSMDPNLCGYAQTWANHLAHTNKFSYRNDREIGQNLFQRPVNNLESDVNGQEVSSYWYSAVRQYDYFKEPDVLHANVNAGHFTQLVWVSTRFFGVGKARSRAGKIIVVAHYSPPGNLSGAFELNVLPPVPDYNMPGPLSYDFDNLHIASNHKDPNDGGGSVLSSNR